MTNRLFEILVDSFWKILVPGITMTVPLTIISFAIALVIAVVVALIQVADIKGLKQLARFYVWVIRMLGASVMSTAFSVQSADGRKKLRI